MEKKLPLLPDIGDIETKPVLKKLARAHQALAELKGVIATIPNQGILINTLSLQVKRTGVLTENAILEIQACIEENSAGYRRLPGTALKNEQTGETVYRPPQRYDEVVALMRNLEQFINDEDMSDWDPLTKMAVIHHQF